MQPAVSDEIDARKQTLRSEARARRRRLAASGADAAAARSVARFRKALPLCERTAVAGYWPLPDEFDCRPLLLALHDDGHLCALPVVSGRDRPLTFRAWTPDTTLQTGSFGVSVPPDDAGTVRPDIVVTPLLAFDDDGYRLGYGGGYYDRTLADLRAQERGVLAVGLAFAGQRVASLPHDDGDEPLDWLISESGAVRFPERTP